MAEQLGVTIDLEDWEAIWALLDEHPETDYLYAIADYRNGLVKFGRSRNPGSRLKALRTGNAASLKLWGYCPHESPFTEREIHGELALFRVSGEWFRLTPEVQATINRMRACSK